MDAITAALALGGGNGGASYSAGTGIDITDNTISVDNTIATKAEVNAKSVVSGTNDGTNWQTININGTSKNIPQPTTYTGGTGISVSGTTISVDSTIATKTEVNAKSTVTGTASGGNWTELTVDGVTNNIPAGGGGGGSLYRHTIYITDNDMNTYVQFYSSRSTEYTSFSQVLSGLPASGVLPCIANYYYLKKYSNSQAQFYSTGGGSVTTNIVNMTDTVTQV